MYNAHKNKLRVLMSIANIFMHKTANWLKRRNLETCINNLIQFDTLKFIGYLHLLSVVRKIYGQNVLRILFNILSNPNVDWQNIIPFTNISTLHWTPNVKVIHYDK